MRGRQPFGYVVSIEGSKVFLNLLDAYRGHFATHPDGVSPVTEIGGLFAVDGGVQIFLLRAISLTFAEPREAHAKGVGSTTSMGEPLRHLEAVVVGRLIRRESKLTFVSDALVSPSLGSEAYPLTTEEAASVLQVETNSGLTVHLGDDIRGGGQLRCGVSDLLARHVAVLGSTGQGKSCFTAAVLQQLLMLPSARIVVFDINGEYDNALSDALTTEQVKRTVLGGDDATFRIPYYALGRHGLGRLLLPSEKTQRPALTFALENLGKVKWFPAQGGAGLVNEAQPSLFDDCRTGDAAPALRAINALREGSASSANEWPHMSALGALVAESHAIKQGRPERDAFLYSNVSPLVTRIKRFTEDPLFTNVVDVKGGRGIDGANLNWTLEGSRLCEDIFGDKESRWKLHIVNLRSVPHDLMPMVLGSLLELLAFELFKKGQQNCYPTLLVLEEAHHYMRRINEVGEEGQNALAYERLAKEGRKFGLSIWLSTQRPSEVSPTVLSQCGTWAVFRLASDQDIGAVGAAAEWVDRQELKRIAGLPRQQAVIFGAGVVMPVRVIAPTANPTPQSSDPNFAAWGTPRSGEEAKEPLKA